MTSLSDLIRELFSRVPQWLEAQLALTKAEIRTESQKMLSVVVWGLVAVTFAYITVLFAGVSLLLLLA
ncbi:phage holin family protein, partial [Streptomyces scabiei]|uniref:phage holin family protein n=1 Tax=Streptomyces scabiei TaxID=1930 RepID=UPI0038F73067